MPGQPLGGRDRKGGWEGGRGKRGERNGVRGGGGCVWG